MQLHWFCVIIPDPEKEILPDNKSTCSQCSTYLHSSFHILHLTLPTHHYLHTFTHFIIHTLILQHFEMPIFMFPFQPFLSPFSMPQYLPAPFRGGFSGMCCENTILSSSILATEFQNLTPFASFYRTQVSWSDLCVWSL